MSGRQSAYSVRLTQTGSDGIIHIRTGRPHNDVLGKTFRPNKIQSLFYEWVNFIVWINGRRSNRHKWENDLWFQWQVFRQVYTSCGFGLCRRKSALLGTGSSKWKKNEITAIPGLLKLLDIEDCIITIDAMGCQKSIARSIKKRKLSMYWPPKITTGNWKNSGKSIYLKYENKFRQANRRRSRANRTVIVSSYWWTYFWMINRIGRAQKVLPW